jgi:shikimate 5-dehydrogenase
MIMINALQHMQRVVIWYMAHKVRAKVQSAAITALKLSLQQDFTKVIITIDHKQKVLRVSVCLLC